MGWGGGRRDGQRRSRWQKVGIRDGSNMLPKRTLFVQYPLTTERKRPNTQSTRIQQHNTRNQCLVHTLTHTNTQKPPTKHTRTHKMHERTTNINIYRYYMYPCFLPKRGLSTKGSHSPKVLVTQLEEKQPAKATIAPRRTPSPISPQKIS